MLGRRHRTGGIAASVALCVTVAVTTAVASPNAEARATEAASRPVTVPARYDPSHVLVGIEPGIDSEGRARIHAAGGGHVVNSLHTVDVVRVPPGRTAADLVHRYRAADGVAHAGFNNYYAPLGAGGTTAQYPNDPWFNAQWNLHNTGSYRANKTVDPLDAIDAFVVPSAEDFDLDAPEGWLELPAAKRSVRVAVIDTGILPHEDINPSKIVACASAFAGTGRITDGVCADDGVDHGTGVASVIAAIRGNGKGVAGIAPEVELVIVKVFTGIFGATRADVIGGLEWAASDDGGNADVINMSFAAVDVDLDSSNGEILTCTSDSAEEAVLRDAHDRGVVLVAAAGNRESACPRFPWAQYPIDHDAFVFPASYSFVISVGGTEPGGSFSSGATCNSEVDLAAPSFDVPAAQSVPPYGFWYGTSFASPHVAAVAALLLARFDLTPDEIRDVLVSSAAPVRPDPTRPDCDGLGQVNLAAAAATAAARS